MTAVLLVSHNTLKKQEAPTQDVLSNKDTELATNLKPEVVWLSSAFEPHGLQQANVGCLHMQSRECQWDAVCKLTHVVRDCALQKLRAWSLPLQHSSQIQHTRNVQTACVQSKLPSSNL